MILWATHLKSLEAVHFVLDEGFYDLGRATEQDREDKLSVPFDPKLSRRTARLHVKANRLEVKRDGSRSPLFVEGEEKEQFELFPGQRFGVAETIFELVSSLGQTITADQVEEARYGQPEQFLDWMLQIQEFLNTEPTIEELGSKVSEIFSNSRVALLKADSLEVFGDSDVLASRSLVGQARKEKQPVFVDWGEQGGQEFTAAEGETWALAVPILTGQEELVLYALGHNQLGPKQRGGLSLLARSLQDHLLARQAGDLVAAKKAIEQLSLDSDPRVRKATQRALRGEEEAQLKVFSMGEFEAYLGGTRLDWGGKQLSWLLSYFATSAQAVPEDRILEDFWPDSSGRAKKSLSVALSRLRKPLQESFEGDPIPRNHSGYRLNEDYSFWHDYEELVDGFDQILSGLAEEQAVEKGEELLKLCRGPYLAGCYLDWASRRRTELERQSQEAFQKLANSALELGAYPEALAFSEYALSVDPCSQSCHLIRMEVFLKQGQAEKAIRQFETCERILRSELDLEPSTDLLRTWQMAKLALP